MDLFFGSVGMVFGCSQELLNVTIPYLNMSVMGLVLGVLVMVVLSKVLIWSIKKGM